MRHGTPASLRQTGTGKVFAAYMPQEKLTEALRREPVEGEEAASDFLRELDTLRRNGVSTVKDELLPGVSAMAVPVFDAFGKLVMAIAAIGPNHLLDLSLDGKQVRALKQLGENVSRQLGNAANAPR
jgi:DNA-binding IclR family transcriptional regulator